MAGSSSILLFIDWRAPIIFCEACVYNNIDAGSPAQGHAIYGREFRLGDQMSQQNPEEKIRQIAELFEKACVARTSFLSKYPLEYSERL
jgi:hypothetical protein